MALEAVVVFVLALVLNMFLGCYISVSANFKSIWQLLECTY
jgi:hypothetical protein